MFCSKCGKEISNNSKFCEFCGQEINGTNKTKKKNFGKIILSVVLIGIFYLLLALPLTYKTDFIGIPIVIKLTYNPIKLQMTLNVGALAYTQDNIGWFQALNIKKKLIFGDYNQIQNFNTQNSELRNLFNNNTNSDYPKICKSNINYGNWKEEWTENCILNDTIYCKDVILGIDKEYPAPKTQEELEKRCKEASEEADIEYEADKNYYENLCKDKNYIKEVAKMNDNADWWDDTCGIGWIN